MSTASTVWIAAGLVVLGLLDGALSGFRASAGRTGLIDHRGSDRVAACRGGLLAGGLLALIAVLAGADLWLGHASLAAYTRAGLAMLVVYGPYGVVVLAALGGYCLLSWRLRYLATALILGPFTLLRPVVASAGGVAAVVVGRNLGVGVCAALAVVAMLVVEPVAGRRWYAGEMVRGGLGGDLPPGHGCDDGQCQHAVDRVGPGEVPDGSAELGDLGV